MKELTRAFNGIEIPVEVIDDENMYFTVSAIARDNGKNITDWKNSKRTLELTKALDKSNTYDLIKVEKEKGKQEVTKIHNSLFVNFARFISVDFEIASNKIIMDILLGSKKICEVERETFQLEIKKLKERRYAKPRVGNFQTVDRIRQDYNFNVTTHDLNVILENKGVLKDIPEQVHNFLPNEESDIAIRQGKTTLVHEDSVMEIFDDTVDLHRDNGRVDEYPTLF